MAVKACDDAGLPRRPGVALRRPGVCKAFRRGFEASRRDFEASRRDFDIFGRGCEGVRRRRAAGVPHLQGIAPPLGPYRMPMPRVLGGS